MSNVFLALDLGAENGRAIAGTLDLDKEKVVLEEMHRFPNTAARINGNLYWDIIRLWGDVRQTIKLTYERFGDRLKSVGVDTWGVDYALLDRNGELVGNPYHYRDHRTDGIMDRVLEKVSKEEIYLKTGEQFLKMNTLYQLYSMVLKNSSQLNIASRFLMLPDLFNYWLTGETFSEFTDATTTQFYDPIRRNWCYDLLEKLEIPTHILSEVVQPGSIEGKISEDLVNELNLSREISVVIPACHDTASAVAAAPLNENSAYVSSGTWSLVGVEIKKPILSKKSLSLNYANEGGAFGTFTFLRNVQGMWFLQECKRVWASEGKDFTYDELIQMASKSRPFVAYIDPDDPRFIAPGNMIDEIIKYVEETNQTLPKNDGELIRVILESLAIKYRIAIEHAMELTGKNVLQINMIGGGSRNWLLNQLTADFTKIRVIAGPVEATSIGNILIQATALGFIKSDELRKIVRGSFEFKEYKPSYNRVYNESYDRFCSLIDRQKLRSNQ